jgi:LPS-assembly protein
LRSIVRLEGHDSQRVSAVAGAHIPLTGNFGELYKFSATLEADGYWTHNFEPGSPLADPHNPRGSDVAGRLFPRISMLVEWPWISTQGGFQQIITPMAQAVVGPDYGNSKDIPNEDSQDFEFDDTNLFALNRFPGNDRIDDGQRIDYGLKYQITTGRGLYSEFFAGQSYSIKNTDEFPSGSGLQGNFSDFVGRVTFNPIREFGATYRFRLDKDSFDPRRQEVFVRAGIPELTFYADYNLFKETDATPSGVKKR